MLERHIKADIKRGLSEAGLDCDLHCQTVSDIVMRAVLDNIIQYTTSMSNELMGKHLHSEAMTSGTIALKLKELRDNL